MKKPSDKEIEEICFHVYDVLRAKGIATNRDQPSIAGIVASAVWRAYHEVSGWRVAQPGRCPQSAAESC